MTSLTEKLNYDPQATEADVLEYLHQLLSDGKAQGAATMPIAQFWQPGDLAQYRAAEAWWPHDAPSVLRCPPIPFLCKGIAQHPPLYPETFMQRLTDSAKRVSAWLAAEGKDVANPNETGPERRARKARERQAAWRARQSKDTDPERKLLLDAKHEAYQAYLSACAERKRISAEQDELVRSALAVWEAAKAALGA